MKPGKQLWVDRALLVLALALVGVVMYTSQAVTSSEVESREGHVLVAWRRDQIESVTLENSSANVTLSKQGSDGGQRVWRVADGGHAKADAAALDQLLSTLSFAMWVNELDAAKVKREEFGLARPRATLTLEMGALRYRLLLGKSVRTPSGAAYLEVTGEGIKGQGIGIVREPLVKALLTDEREFLGRSLVPFGRMETTRLELTGAGGTRRIVRDGHRFRFDGMLDNRYVDGEMLDPVFFHLARLNLERFLDLEQARSALEQGEAVVVELWGKDSKTSVKLRVGGTCPSDPAQVVAIRDRPHPLAGCVPGTVMAGLAMKAERLLDFTPFSFSTDAVERLVIQRPLGRLELVRTEGDFSLKAPVEAKVDLERGNRRIQTIVDSQGEVVQQPNLAELGLAPPRGTATVTGLSEVTDTTADESIDLGKLDEEGRLAIRRQSDGLVLLLAPDAARAFQVDATLSKSLGVFEFSEKNLVSLSVRTPELGQRIVQKGGSYHLERPEGFDFDATLVSSLVSSLGDLKAERWVSDTPDTSFGLDHPAIEVTVETLSKNGPSVRTLSVGEEVPGGAYASVSRIPGVFVLSAQALRAITTPVISRRAFVFDPSAFHSIRLDTHKRSLLLTARGDSWVANTASVDAAHAKRIVEALENLRPEFAVHTGAAIAREGFSDPVLRIVAIAPPEGTDKLIRIGAAHSFRDMSGYFARASGVEATFAMSQQPVQELLDLL